MSTNENKVFGFDDGSYLAAGGIEGIQRLVEKFYDIMGNRQEYETIYAMHPRDINISIDKLARFLCGWMGGPKRYQERYGSINIPAIHAHLKIGVEERDQWLSCMKEAIAEQEYEEAFKAYLYEQLSIPANVILRRCENQG